MSLGNERDQADSSETSIVLVQLQRLDAAIEKEFTLISDRMTWIVVSEAFIFGAFVDAAVSYEAKNGNISVLLISLLLLLSFIGFCIPALAYGAILAAHKAVDLLKMTRANLEDKIKDPLCVRLVSLQWKTHSQGNYPARTLPVLFMGIWFCVGVLLFVQLIVKQWIAGIVAVVCLVILVGFVVYSIRAAILQPIANLDSRLRALESQKLPGTDTRSA